MVNGQRVGYIRVSSVDQNQDRQLEGVDLDRTFTDSASGKDTQRPGLASMLSYVRDGDVVIVHSMDRLARNLDDLRRYAGRIKAVDQNCCQCRVAAVLRSLESWNHREKTKFL